MPQVTDILYHSIITAIEGKEIHNVIDNSYSGLHQHMVELLSSGTKLIGPALSQFPPIGSRA